MGIGTSAAIKEVVSTIIIANKPEINGQSREKGYNNPVSG